MLQRVKRRSIEPDTIGATFDRMGAVDHHQPRGLGKDAGKACRTPQRIGRLEAQVAFVLKERKSLHIGSVISIGIVPRPGVDHRFEGEITAVGHHASFDAGDTGPIEGFFPHGKHRIDPREEFVVIRSERRVAAPDHIQSAVERRIDHLSAVRQTVV